MITPLHGAGAHNTTHSSPAPAGKQLPVATAAQIHGYLVESFSIRNRASLRFALLLAALAESRLYLELGHPTLAHYVEHTFQLGRTETHETLRVAGVIHERPRLREAFERGRLSWSSLKAITRVATEQTEGEWLAFAEKRTVAELRAEVQDAREKQRDRPRTDRYGLPNLMSRMILDLTHEERARLDAALEHAAGAIAGPMGDEPLSAKDVLLYMVERFLHTDAQGLPEGCDERSDPPFAIVYHQCETCRRSRLISADGAVEVDPAIVDRRKGAAVEEHLAASPEGNPEASPELEVVVESDPQTEAPGEPAVDRPNPALRQAQGRPLSPGG